MDNKVRRQGGFPTFIMAQRHNVRTPATLWQSHQSENICDVNMVSLVARWPVFWPIEIIFDFAELLVDGEPYCSLLKTSCTSSALMLNTVEPSWISWTTTCSRSSPIGYRWFHFEWSRSCRSHFCCLHESALRVLLCLHSQCGISKVTGNFRGCSQVYPDISHHFWNVGLECQGTAPCLQWIWWQIRVSLDLRALDAAGQPDSGHWCFVRAAPGNCWILPRRPCVYLIIILDLSLLSLRLPRKCPLNFVSASFQLPSRMHVTSDALGVGGYALLNDMHERQYRSHPQRDCRLDLWIAQAISD